MGLSFAGSALLKLLVLCEISPVKAINPLQKQKSRLFCNFFAIADSFPFQKSKIRPQCSQLPGLFRLNPQLGISRQSLIAKKLHHEPIFCFWSSGDDFKTNLGQFGEGGEWAGAVLRTDGAKWPRAVPQRRPFATLQKQKARASKSGCPRYVFKRWCALL